MNKLLGLACAAIILGALAWNGWVFGSLNHGGAGYIDMSISELEVVGQPHAGLFNDLEDVSGVLLIVGAAGMFTLLPRRSILIGCISLAIALIGALTLYDVAHPLDCNRYNNPVCLRRVNNNEVSHTDAAHNDESRITCYVTLVLALLLVLWVRGEKYGFSVFVATIALGLVLFLSLIILDLDSSIIADAVAERIWNAATSMDIGLVGWIVYRKTTALKT